MCGIAGVFGEASESLAREFCRILEHRGPDDQGTFVSIAGPVTLASRQPLPAASTTILIPAISPYDAVLWRTPY